MIDQEKIPDSILTTPTQEEPPISTTAEPTPADVARIRKTAADQSIKPATEEAASTKSTDEDVNKRIQKKEQEIVEALAAAKQLKLKEEELDQKIAEATEQAKALKQVKEPGGPTKIAEAIQAKKDVKDALRAGRKTAELTVKALEGDLRHLLALKENKPTK